MQDITDEQRAFAAKVVALKAEAGRLGLYQTMQALEPATQTVGWELAERMGGKSSKRLRRITGKIQKALS